MTAPSIEADMVDVSSVRTQIIDIMYQKGKSNRDNCCTKPFAYPKKCMLQI